MSLPKKCKKCIYRGVTAGIHTCDYILHAKQSRGCSIAECEHYHDEANHRNEKAIAAMHSEEAAVKRAKTKKSKTDLRDAYWKSLYDQGLTDAQIGNIVGRHHTTVTGWRMAHHLPIVPAQQKPKGKYDRSKIKEIPNAYHINRRKAADERDKDILPLYEAGYNDAQIARMTGRTDKQVFAYRKRNNLPSKHKQGEHHAKQ